MTVQRLPLALLLGLLFVSVPLCAGPVVSYTVGGSSGDWLLDFAVTNSLGTPGLDIYFFGVQLPARDIRNSPVAWDSNAWTAWDNLYYGGSSLVYNNNWITWDDELNVGMGEILSGFQVRVTDAVAPSSVRWFAYATGTAYPGTDHFNSDGNPGFEGIAGEGAAAVPEPATFALLAVGLAGLALRRLRA